MLQSTIIGYLGGDAELKSANGREFVVFRIANTERWTDDAGNAHEQTIWVDCIMNGRPHVFEYLKKGSYVYASGSVSLRVYSSPKDRCMKAGMTINVRNLELLNGRTDEVPSKLYKAEDGSEIQIMKVFCAPALMNDKKRTEPINLVSGRGNQFTCDVDGIVRPLANIEQS